MSPCLGGPTAHACAYPYAAPVPEQDLHDYIRLSHELATVLGAHCVRVDGRDHDVEEFAAFQGLRRSDALIVPVRLQFHNNVVLLVARTQTWRRARRKLLEIKRMAAHAKRRVILIPAGHIRRPIYLVNCSIIGASATTQVTATARLTVVEQLIADPNSTIRDCALSIGEHHDPVGAILSMIGSGFLRADLQKQIGPDTPISLA